MASLAEGLKVNPRFAPYLDERTIDLLYKTAPLHDIGKVGVPDLILLKQDGLDSEEWEVRKRHTDYGHEALVRAEQELGSTDFPEFARDIVYTYHERWDGTGYPRGLRGEEIPIAGRLMAIADVYDALINQRAYKPAFPHRDAVEMIRKEGGSHFDPDAVDAFIASQDELRRIGSLCADSP
jgi:putative two-component system response regulator